MGTCQYCYHDESTEELPQVKTLSLKAGPEFNAIDFTFTNRPMTEFKGNCLVVYADHVRELNESVAFTNIRRKVKRKIFQYLTLAEQQAERNHLKHYCIPISIPGLNFTNLMLVKMQPWDGGSKHKIEDKIYQLTVGYLESFSLRKIKDFTVVQFDPLSGIHYSLSLPPISKALQVYCSDIKNVNILCNSVESMDCFYRKIRYYKDKGLDFELLKECKDSKEKKKERKRSKNENIMIFG